MGTAWVIVWFPSDQHAVVVVFGFDKPSHLDQSAAAALSHEGALAAYEVCDILPERIHITVSPARHNGKEADALEHALDARR